MNVAGVAAGIPLKSFQAVDKTEEVAVTRPVDETSTEQAPET